MILFKRLRQYRWYLLGRRKIKKQILNAQKLKVNLGSSGTHYKGWIATDLPHFDILVEKNWSYFFNTVSIDNILAEHVLEHLTKEQVIKVLTYAYKYLKEEGVFRIAVPDRNHPNPNYIEFVRPGGSGVGADDHKSFWDFKTMSGVAKSIGFSINLLEHVNDSKNIITSNFSEADGNIIRSLSKGYKGEINNYSSLIIDLRK